VNPEMLNPSKKSIKFDELNPEAVFTPPYEYDALAAEDVRDVVPAFAGAGVLDWSVLNPDKSVVSIPQAEGEQLIKVYSANSSIIVSGAKESSLVRVYSLSGVQLYKGNSNNLSATFSQGFYVVTVDGKGYKVLVK